jgi:hypothetical protein
MGCHFFTHFDLIRVIPRQPLLTLLDGIVFIARARPLKLLTKPVDFPSFLLYIAAINASRQSLFSS